MYPIIFKTGHALLLPLGRLLSPRHGRETGAEQPRTVTGAWPQTRHIHKLDSAEDRTRTQTMRVREQSVSACSPRKQSWPRPILVHAQATASTVRGQAAAANAKCPQTVHSREPSMSANWPWAKSARKHGLATKCPRRCIAVAILPPICFPVRIQTIPAHVLI